MDVPYDITAEEAVLGSLLIDGEASLVATLLKPGDFFSELNQIIFTACVELDNRNIRRSQITVASELSRAGKLDNMGGVAQLSHLISICPTSLDLFYYAEIVKRLAMSRELIQVGAKISELGYKASPDMAESLKEVDEMILNLRKKSSSATIITPHDRAEKMMTRYDELNQVDNGIAIKTGLYLLDEWLGGGLYGGDLIILGARPGMGKTTFLQSVANYVSHSSKVLFASGEMSAEALTDRDVAGIVELPTNRIRLGHYDDMDYSAIVKALGVISERQVYILDETPLTTAKIQQAALGMKQRVGLDLLVVDYLGLLDDKEGENQNIRLGHISRRLKYIARSLNIPVLVAHQLSRASEMRAEDDRRPRLSDLRESGHIEEDADSVLLLYRASYYGKLDDTTEVIIAKQRQGQSNKIIKVKYDAQTQAYCDYELEVSLDD